jgi:hypothetical protein
MLKETSRSLIDNLKNRLKTDNTLTPSERSALVEVVKAYETKDMTALRLSVEAARAARWERDAVLGHMVWPFVPTVPRAL